MDDLIITGASSVDDRTVDVRIGDGLISDVSEPGELVVRNLPPDRILEAESRLLTPEFIKPHTHLDLALTGKLTPSDHSGTLREWLVAVERLDERMTQEQIESNATATVEQMVTNGVTKIWTHVCTSLWSDTTLSALLAVREQLQELVEAYCGEKHAQGNGTKRYQRSMIKTQSITSSSPPLPIVDAESVGSVTI